MALFVFLPEIVPGGSPGHGCFLHWARSLGISASGRVSGGDTKGSMIANGLQEQTLAASAGRDPAARWLQVPRGQPLRPQRDGDHCPPCLPSGRLPRLAVVPLESDRRQPSGAQQLPRSGDWKTDRARPRMAAESDPPSRFAASVLADAPEWASFSDGEKIDGGGKPEGQTCARRARRGIARRGRKRRGRAKAAASMAASIAHRRLRQALLPA